GPGGDLPGRRDAVHPRHLDVEQDDVGSVLDREGDRLVPVPALGDDGDVVLRVEQRAQPAADERLVVHQHDPDHPASPVGSSARTAKPPPGRPSATRWPPSAAVRSRIPTSPSPVGAGAPASPRPASSSRTTTQPGRWSTWTRAVLARACRVTLVSASWTIR